MGAPTITSIATWGVIQLAVAAGADEATLLRAAGLPAGRPDLERHIPAERHLHVWELAMERVLDPQLPIRVATAMDLADLEVFGFLVAASATAAEAFEHAARYRRLYLQGARWEMSQYPGELRLTWYPWFEAHRHDLGRRCADQALVVEMMHCIRSITGKASLAARAVTFAHGPIAESPALEAYFGVAPSFGAPLTELVFPPEVGQLPVSSSNSRLRDYFDRQCRELLAKFAADRPVTLAVKKELLSGIHGELPEKEEVGRRLGMSARSLHRRLEEEGTSFKALVDEVRIEVAKRYLTRPAVSASEVGYLLGFSETSAFFRAFKRWTGMTPQQYRAGSGA